MIGSIMQKPQPFDVVVMSELSRLGRDMVNNAVVIGKIRDAGVQIFYYLTGTEESFDTPEQRFMAMATSFGAEIERARIAQRTRDALSRKAEHGYSAGGRCYGYDNVWVFADGREVIAAPGARMKDETKLRTDWRINAEQAEVVRGVFRMYADGYGHTLISKTMNGDRPKDLKKYFAGRTPAPAQHGEQGTGSWSPSSIRVMLYRIRYAGKVQYGEYRNVRNGGRAGKCVKQDKFSVVDRPDLRIVEPALWDRVQQRLKAVRAIYVRDNNGTLWGRPDSGRASKYLLTGLARCGCKNGNHVCGRNIVVSGGQRQSHYYYGCSYNQYRGSNICGNDTRARMAEIDEVVLNEIEAKVLTPEAVQFVADEAVRLYEAALKEKPERLPQLEADLKRERRELANIMQLLASGNAPKTVLADIAARERRIEALAEQVAMYQAPRRSDDLEFRRVRKQALQHVGRFKDLLRSTCLWPVRR
jgi:site-specific DNA recombinase